MVGLEMNIELEITWKEAVGLTVVLSGNFTGGTDENHENRR
jgi:hypothetical protein